MLPIRYCCGRDIVGGRCIKAEVAHFEIGLCYLQLDGETTDTDSWKRAKYQP